MMNAKPVSTRSIRPFAGVGLLGGLFLVALVLAPQARPLRAGDGPVTLTLETYVPGGELQRPTAMAHAGDGRLFVVEQAGRIRVVHEGGDVVETPFLDISDRVTSGGERGLLGLAFHPNYAETGYFYVNYTDTRGDTHIARFQVTADPDVADEDSEHTILMVEQPYGNHNAGDLAFGPQDGYLYIPLGDGGSGDDPQNRAQNMSLLLGKMLRVDVDMEDGGPADCGEPGAYTIPADNPFAGDSDVCDEIWAAGLRNPWRVSFDRQTHDFYISDVGQNAWEEVNRQPAASAGGENYGWSCFEGAHPNPNTHMSDCQDASAYDMPIFEYGHHDVDGVCAVTGGYVYRGSQYPALQGRYLLTDYCSGDFWDLDVDNGFQATRHSNLQQFGFTTFGQDAGGELYVANAADGRILRIAAEQPFEPSEWRYLPVVRKE
ncbi:MAG TPA: PQQ-dependent sugar dehydrogenase [Candidatus Sulfomarinibacteraceae bacterium]|nr:PQQ-dependent sugar dehydrogenase [Candidatus Sulfomarinibacteraceae bacterium]